MGRLSGFVVRMKALLGRRSFERELDEELRFHVEMETEARLGRGLTPEEAKRSARVIFGAQDGVRESVRAARGLGWVDDLRADGRYAARSLRRNRLFAGVAIVTLGLGIGATTAVYSVVDGVLLRPLPWADADRLAVVWEFDRITGTQREAASVPDYVDFRDRSRTFESLAAFDPQPMNLAVPGQGAERVRVALVTPQFFPTLGVTPRLGRFFEPADALPGGPLVAVISEELWQTRLGGEPSVIGSTLIVDDMPVEVIGVARAGLDWPEAETSVWGPMRIDPGNPMTQRATHNIGVFGRLAPGATLESAQAEMTALAAELEATFPDSNRGRGVFVESIRDAVVGNVRPALLILLGSVLLVLLIACVNVANLLLARGASRVREVAIRGALGASGGRLARQFAVESVVLALTGGALGVLLALLGLNQLLALAPQDLPRADAIGLDGRVLLASLLLTIFVGLLFGLVPLQQARRIDLQSTLREEGRGGSATRGRQRFRSGLVVAEIALSVILLVGAGLMIRSLVALQAVDPGFAPDNLLKVEYVLPESRYPQSFANFPVWPEVQRFQRETRERIAAVPGVESVALATQHPMNPGFTNSFVIVGRENEYESQPEVPTRVVSAGYFETAGVPVLRGRVMDETDGMDSPRVLVINQAMADRFFEGRDPLGEHLAFWGQDRGEIIGVVGNERFAGLGEDAPMALYAALPQAPLASGSILVRTSVPPLSVAEQVRAAIASVDGDLAVYAVSTMDDAVRSSVARERFATMLLSVFAATALVLALIGVHGLLSYTVAQRIRELGIRMALGASRNEVVGMVLRSGLAMALLGIAIGLLGAFAAAGALRGLLYGVGAADPITFVAVTVAMLATALLACLSPARRATAADPMHALRID